MDIDLCGNTTYETENTVESPDKERCFKGLGCFGLEYPWVSPERPYCRLPEDPNTIGTSFYLSTKNHQGPERRKLHLNLLQVSGRDWGPGRWTVIIAHGFRASANSTWVRALEAALLEIEEMNVISVDWSRGSSGLNYIRAAVNARVVGVQIARLISYLLDHRLASVKKIHLIGQSLGAHALSYVSATVRNIARLTALDPAQPGFEGTHPDTRVDPTDADFVDVIHTNAAHFIFSLGLGMISPIGHVDFFVNGGKKQPGCWLHKGIWGQVSAVSSYIIDKFEDIIGCSHQKASVYYIEALKTNCSFWGRRLNLSREPEPEICSPATCQQMGRHTLSLPARGTFHVTTHTKPPYCLREPVNDFIMNYYISGKTKDKEQFNGI